MRKKLGKKDVRGESPFVSKYEFVYLSKERGEIKIDVAASCRFYVNDVLNDDRNALPLRSKEMLLWLIGKVRSGEDVVVINRERYMKEIGLTSLPVVIKAIKGLINMGIIAKTNVRGVYWLNAVYFFRGSRVRKWPMQSSEYIYAREMEGRDMTNSENLPF